MRSPARYRALQAASYGAAAAIVGGVTVVYGALLGVPGVGRRRGVRGLLRLARATRTGCNKATVLLVHDRLDEAEALLRKVLSSWRCRASMRALAEQNLAPSTTGAATTRRRWRISARR